MKKLARPCDRRSGEQPRLPLLQLPAQPRHLRFERLSGLRFPVGSRHLPLGPGLGPTPRLYVLAGPQVGLSGSRVEQPQASAFPPEDDAQVRAHEGAVVFQRDRPILAARSASSSVNRAGASVDSDPIPIHAT